MIRRLRPAKGFPWFVQLASLLSSSCVLAWLFTWSRVPWRARAAAALLLWCFDRKVLLGYYPPAVATAAVTRLAKKVDDVNADLRPPIALTIDDAPVLEFDGQPAEKCSTVRMHQLLTKFQARATWFIIGSNVTGDRKAVVEELVRTGHELGNHGMLDRPAYRLSREEFVKDVQEAQVVVESLGGRRKWFRPGHALATPWKLRWLKEQGYRLALGSIYPHDALDLPPWQCSWAWLLAWVLVLKASPGDVIIIHDRPWNVRALELALPSLTDRFKVCTLSELADLCEGAQVLPAGHQTAEAEPVAKTAPEAAEDAELRQRLRTG